MIWLKFVDTAGATSRLNFLKLKIAAIGVGMRRWNTPKSSTKTTFKIGLGNPLGIGCSTQRDHTVLLDARLKVFD
jgi:hypothetical protein